VDTYLGSMTKSSTPPAPMPHRQRLYDDTTGTWSYGPVLTPPRKTRSQMLRWSYSEDEWELYEKSPMQYRGYVQWRKVLGKRLQWKPKFNFSMQEVKQKLHLEDEGFMWEALLKHVSENGKCDGFLGWRTLQSFFDGDKWKTEEQLKMD